MAGYSGTPLFKKLGIKSDHRVFVQNAPDNYRALLGDYPGDTVFVEIADDIDIAHVFTNRIDELLESIVSLRRSIRKNGAIWISWYKKASKMPTEITEDDVRSAALSNGLVDVKVCAVDECWSGLKLVIPLADR